MSTISREKTRNSQLHNVKHPKTHSITFISISINASIDYTVLFMQITFQKEYVTSQHHQKDSIICIILLRRIKIRYIFFKISDG